MVRFIENMDQWKALMEMSKEKLVVVDFTASWCGPCQFIAPKYEELSKKYTDIEFVKVDVDAADDVSALCGIQAMPTFQFYKGGVKVDEMKGADLNGLVALIGKHTK